MKRLPVAEEYVQRLLRSGDALEAVARLAGFWAPRINADAPMFGLVQPEFDVQLCRIYTGEVGNGGHDQYLYNHGAGYVLPTLDALTRIGIVELHEVLTQLTHLLPALPRDRMETQEMVAALPVSAWNKLNALDPLVWGAHGVDEKLLSYLRLHGDEILLAERG